MVTAEAPDISHLENTPEAVREQLELLVRDPSFSTSRRSVQFLRYVVEKTLRGDADHIKERTIGIDVFGRDPAYDTNVDHVVRTAAIELRKRLAIYYGEPAHRDELHISLVPGSYIPRFHRPATEADSADGSHANSLEVPPAHGHPMPAAIKVAHRHVWPWVGVAALAVLAIATYGYRHVNAASSQDLFWKPVLDTPGNVLLAVGDVPNGPPTPSVDAGEGTSIPVIHKTDSPTVPFADAVTLARVEGILAAHGKHANIRRERDSSFADLREGPVVLVGAFNNEWSLRLTRHLRYSLALDPDQHLIYIADAKDPKARTWSWHTDQSREHQGAAGTPRLQDYALISRIWNSETGHAVVVIGGLYTYGTQAAGEFLSDPVLMQSIAETSHIYDPHRNLQLVIGTTVTDGTPGPPRVLAVSSD